MVLVDFQHVRMDDGILTVSMAPPVAVDGWSIRFEVFKHFGGVSGMMLKSYASGYNGVSGITITNSGQGVFNVRLNQVDTSGLEYGNYACQITRMNSGARTVIDEGFITITP